MRELTEGQCEEVVSIVKELAYKPSSRIEVFSDGQGFVLHTMEFPTPHSPPGWMRGATDSADDLGRVPMHWEFEDLALRVAELMTQYPKLTVRQATFVVVLNVIHDEELHEIHEWVSIDGEHVLNPHGGDREWMAIVAECSETGLAR